jgi:hypothetical protein
LPGAFGQIDGGAFLGVKCGLRNQQQGYRERGEKLSAIYLVYRLLKDWKS